MTEDLEILQGAISAVVYQNYENGYAVLRVNVGGGQNVTAGQGECIAYVNGKKVSGDAAVMQLVSSDLRSLDDASDAVGGNVEQQLNNLGAAIEIDN